MHVVRISIPFNQLQVCADCGRWYTCPIKEINGEQHFKFKGEWHKVRDYTTPNTRIIYPSVTY